MKRVVILTEKEWDSLHFLFAKEFEKELNLDRGYILTSKETGKNITDSNHILGIVSFIFDKVKGKMEHDRK